MIELGLPPRRGESARYVGSGVAVANGQVDRRAVAGPAFLLALFTCCVPFALVADFERMAGLRQVLRQRP